MLYNILWMIWKVQKEKEENVHLLSYNPDINITISLFNICIQKYVIK